MAIHLQRDCPHCLTVKAPLSGGHFIQVTPGQHAYVIFMQCGVCGEGVLVKVNHPNIGPYVQGGIANPIAYVVESWPKVTEQKAPLHTPDNVKSFYLQGIDSLARRNFDAAGTMFRKALDAGLRKVHPDGKGTLEKRIDSLPDELGITPAMKEWAHNIRDLGNDAAHENEPFLEQEAKDLHSFTELFLTYAFTLPGMIDARKPKPA